MSDSRRIVRLPALPSWEKLLTRLSVLPETQFDQTALRLELIGQLTDQGVSVTQLFSRICAFLPRVVGCEGVVIWFRGEKGPEILATNLPPRRSLSSLETRTVRRLARKGHRFFNRRLSEAIVQGKVEMSYCHSVSIGESDGRECYLLALSGRPLSSPTIRVVEVVCRALSLRLQNQQLVREVQAYDLKLNNFTRQLGEGMALLNPDLAVTLWNRALQKLTGFKADEAIGRKLTEVLRRVDIANWLEELVAKQTDPEPKHTHLDFEITAKNGVQRWVNCLISVYRTPNRQIEQVVLIVRDISHKKSLEQKKNEFISIATHELRTPLTAVKGYLSLLDRTHSNLTEKQRSYLSQATKASNRLIRLAEDLLKVIQIDQDRIQFKPQTFHLFSLLKKIVRDFKPKAAAKGITLSLSGSGVADSVRLDPERTEQVFANLIDNATKYTNQGSVKIWLERTEDRSDHSSRLIVNIRDTGIGINTKNPDEVFEKFHRAHRQEQSKEQGAGLGLYIVKSFIEKQGGTISLKSRVGKGTHFVVSLPIEPARRSKK